MHCCLNRKLIPVFSVLFFIFFSVSCYRYSVPDNPYIITASTNLGTVDILIPSNYRHSLALSGNTPINTNSSSFNGYINRGSATYTVRFPVYGQPEYRQDNVSSSYWSTLTFSSVNLERSTVDFIDAENFSIFNNDIVMNALLIFSVLIIFYLLLRKRL